MAITREDVLIYLEEANMLEISDLVKEIEVKFGVSSSAQMAVAAAPGTAPSAEEEKDSFNVVLADFGSSKINVIKVVRAITELGLKEAKELVDSKGTVKEDVTKEEAESIKKQLEEAGATVEMK